MFALVVSKALELPLFGIVYLPPNSPKLFFLQEEGNPCSVVLHCSMTSGHVRARPLLFDGRPAGPAGHGI